MVEEKRWKPLARELTGWELLARVKEGHDIALLPVGSTEMHGPQLPLATDTYIAEAVCQIAAAKMRATVFDTVSYTWPGLTKYSKPTISMTMEMEAAYVRMICDQLARNGLRRIYVIQFHGPGIAMWQVAREFFEETGVPLAFFGLMHMPNNRSREAREAGIAWEASLCAAAAKLLGCDATIDPGAWAEDIPMTLFPGQEAQQAIASTGAKIGFLGTNDWHHGTFRGRLDPDVGLEMLNHLAEIIASTADAMAEMRDQWQGQDLPASWESAV